MKTIGVTGGIGSGKTVVSRILLASGHPVYDSDRRAKELTNSSAVIKEKLTALVGDNVYKAGVLDRKLLADYIFASSENMLAVDSVIHPEVKADFDKWRLRQKSDTVFIESAILFESGFSGFTDEIWCVTAPLELRIERVIERNGITRREVEERIASQLDDEARNSLSGHVIVNDGKIPLLPQLERIFPQL